MNDIIYNEELINKIGNIIISARENVTRQVNSELIMTYWNIGRVIVEE